MPGFPKSMDNPLFYWSPTCSTNWDPHFVMATQAVQLQIYLTGIFLQLNPVDKTQLFLDKTHKDNATGDTAIAV